MRVFDRRRRSPRGRCQPSRATFHAHTQRRRHVRPRQRDRGGESRHHGRTQYRVAVVDCCRRPHHGHAGEAAGPAGTGRNRRRALGSRGDVRHSSGWPVDRPDDARADGLRGDPRRQRRDPRAGIAGSLAAAPDDCRASRLCGRAGFLGGGEPVCRTERLVAAGAIHRVTGGPWPERRPRGRRLSSHRKGRARRRSDAAPGPAERQVWRHPLFPRGLGH